MNRPVRSPTDFLPAADLGRKYLDHLVRLTVDPAALTSDADASELLAVAYRGRFLPSPVFLSAAERDCLAADLRCLYTMLMDIPDRLHDGDLRQFAQAVGMNPQQVSAVLRGANTGAPLVPLARSDLYRDNDGFKLLELNITSALGGFENADINRAMLKHPALREFTDEHGLGYIDTLQHIVDSLRAECAANLPDGRRPVVALTDWPASFVTYEPRLRVMAALLGEMGLDALPCHVGQLRSRGDRLVLEDQVIDVVFRFFLVEEIVTEDDLAAVEPILDAATRGALGLFSRLDAELYGNKGALALLSGDRFRATCTPAERDCLDRFLPWTRPVQPTVTDTDGSEHELMTFAAADQDDLVLKPTLLHGGNGIVPGWTVSPEQWRARVTEAMGQPYVLQRRVRPRPEPFAAADGDGRGTENLYLNWGVFLSDPDVTGASDGYGGCIVRGSTDPAVGVVSMSGGARVGCCFHEERP
ncbi:MULTISPECIES: hypothetical protein [Frankia]|uniref:Glutathionylspermidine synthase pre-ATP-grasp-like domain-containing protein n=1 Tax=Frankia alni (strain DSM 45986 / CECT 9034 / ACN14a) TaxID=326424 RepID=Q0RGT8_FRAAA|nr:MULTISPECIES: hypothetical protein [Frankia]CAJ63298.1 hypothetical protein; putative Glutathione synthetase ATP-binding domain [Frankia alni ACN14a]